MWSSYFDDFFSVEEEELSRHTETVIISSLFSKLPVDKLVDYSTVCKVLG